MNTLQFLLFITTFFDIHKNLMGNEYLLVKSSKDISIGRNFFGSSDNKSFANKKKRFVFNNGTFKHFSTIHIFYYENENSGEVEIFIQKDNSGNHLIRTDYSKAKGVRTYTTLTKP